MATSGLAGAAPPVLPRWSDPDLPWREPADRRVDVRHMDLDVQLDLAAHSVAGRVTYTGTAQVDIDAVVLQARDFTPTTAHWEEGGKPVPAAWVKDGDDLRFALPAARTAPGWKLRLQWTVQPRAGFWFHGPDADEPARLTQAWTQGETSDARHWLPSPDDPDERMTWTVAVTAPAGLLALSNGRLLGSKPAGPLATTRFEMTTPLPIYLFAIAVGAFAEVRHAHPKRELVTWVEPALQSDVARTFGRLPHMVDTFERLLGTPYPFARYGQVVVAEFVAGGMENASLTLLTDRAVPDLAGDLDWEPNGLLAHELAHQWFGDLVTCRTWGDLWLNEGWATYLDWVWHEQAFGPTRFHEELDAGRRAYLAEAKEFQRPTVADRYDDPEDLFDRHSYLKGAWAAHMLRRKLGEAAFWAGLKGYFAAHGPGSVETADLRRAFEAASGQSLRGFFQRWLHEAGHPAVKARLHWDGGAKLLKVGFEQTQKVTSQQPAFDLPLAIAVWAKAGDVPVQATYRLRTANGEWTLALPAPPARVEIDADAALLIDWTTTAPPAWLAAQATTGTTPEVRIRAVRDLGRDPGARPAVEALAKVLAADSARHVRAAAADALKGAERALARPALLRALEQDAESMVRAEAVEALGELHDGAAWDAVDRTAHRDVSPQVRRAALRALATIDRRRARDTLLEATSWPSRRQTLEGTAFGLLGSLGDARDRDVLWRATEPGRPKALREATVGALAAWGAKVEPERDAIRQHLEGLLHEPTVRMRDAVGRALGALGDAAAIPALRAAAGREIERRVQKSMLRAADSIARNLPLEERLKRLEDALEKLQREGRDGKAAHGL
ncbi:MAG: hypothetical protein EXR79_03965 [Myxococcales bacterium]|nr:hypothetical protein [Myxococcales bacterium]